MTTRITRLAGAILLQHADEYFLIGNTKQPCDWRKAGFHPPENIDAVNQAFIRLFRSGEVVIEPPFLTTDASTAESLAQILANRFVIRRNGSVSDRLWRVVTGENDDTDVATPPQIDANWLVNMPDRVWQIIRDTVLKCL